MPLPEGDLFHHAQFSLTAVGSKELTTFTGKPGKGGGRKGGKGDDGRWRQGKNQGMGKDDGRWRQEWNNTMVQCDWHDDAKPSAHPAASAAPAAPAAGGT